MPATVIIGTQWGDEGKGKITDYFGKDADVIITRFAQMTRRVMEALPKCKAIVRYGIGYDTIDVNAATDTGILVVNIPDFCLEEVSNHVFMLLLSCAKRLLLFNSLTKQGR